MRVLLIASAAIAAIAVAAPELVSRYADLDGDPGGRFSEAATKLAIVAPQRSTPVRQVEIETARDGHFYVEAEINRRPVRFLVDTGASVVALRRSDAEAVGIRPRKADFDQPVATANGTAYAAAAELDSVTVADIEVSRVRALILPDEQLRVSLLGASFLNRLQRYQVEDGAMIFEN